jgi:branched-chain amino acid transport system ATP-binding protein
VNLLTVQGVHCHHGLLPAVRGVSFEVAEGETLALLGANGAGKTTLLRAIAGAHRLSAGRVAFAGRDVTGISGHGRVGLGIALVPEGRRLFPGLTVEQNLLIASSRRRPGRWHLESLLEAFPILRPLRGRLAANLSGGEQQAVAIARALISNPRLLLLDEVSLGLAPRAVDDVYRSLEQVMGGGTSVVLVEQDLGRALDLSGRVICLLEGQVVLEGATPALTREQVISACLAL